MVRRRLGIVLTRLLFVIENGTRLELKYEVLRSSTLPCVLPRFWPDFLPKVLIGGAEN